MKKSNRFVQTRGVTTDTPTRDHAKLRTELRAELDAARTRCANEAAQLLQDFRETLTALGWTSPEIARAWLDAVAKSAAGPSLPDCLKEIKERAWEGQRSWRDETTTIEMDAASTKRPG